MTGFQLRPISGALGAELHGVDLGADLSAAEVGAIRQALLDHGVIFFRDQDFDTAAHKRLARRFEHALQLGTRFLHLAAPVEQRIGHRELLAELRGSDALGETLYGALAERYASVASRSAR